MDTKSRIISFIFPKVCTSISLLLLISLPVTFDSVNDNKSLIIFYNNKDKIIVQRIVINIKVL